MESFHHEDKFPTFNKVDNFGERVNQRSVGLLPVPFGPGARSTRSATVMVEKFEAPVVVAARRP